MDDSYLIIEKEALVETKVKGSRFLGETRLVRTVDEAAEALKSISKREHAATHHCYAYRVGMGDDKTFKYSDDGEPSGTAGRPIYDTIIGRNLTNLLLVVTRYFGGTKLGTGGLVRAYSEAAVAALDASGKRECFLVDRFKVELEFAHFDQITKLIHAVGARQIDADFSDRVKLILEIRKSKGPELTNAITELTAGRAIIKRIESGETA